MIEEFSDRSKQIFNLANNLAIKQNHTLIAHHILYALIDNSDKYIIHILRDLGSDIGILKKKIKKYSNIITRKNNLLSQKLYFCLLVWLTKKATTKIWINFRF